MPAGNWNSAEKAHSCSVTSSPRRGRPCGLGQGSYSFPDHSVPGQAGTEAVLRDFLRNGLPPACCLGLTVDLPPWAFCRRAPEAHTNRWLGADADKSRGQPPPPRSPMSHRGQVPTYNSPTSQPSATAGLAFWHPSRWRPRPLRTGFPRASLPSGTPVKTGGGCSFWNRFATLHWQGLGSETKNGSLAMGPSKGSGAP